jgi:HEAT repeat protein
VEPLFPLVAAAIAMSIAALVASERRRAHLRAWRKAVAQAGLSDVEEAEGGIFGGERVSGRSGHLDVRLESYQHGKHDRGTQIVVTGLGHGMGGLTLRREGFSTAFEKRIIGEREIEIGDPAFDDEYDVRGATPLALAVLGNETRRRVAGLLRGRVAVTRSVSVEVGASLSGGVLQVRVREGAFHRSREWIPEVLSTVLDVARLLVAPADIPRRLAENLRGEPVAGVRLQCLLTLTREFPGHPATREALLAARADESEEVRLRAGLALGAEGREVLLEVASREWADDSCAARAIDALGAHLAVDRAEKILGHALRTRRLAAARACLEALGRFGGAGAVGPLAKVLAVERGELGGAAAEALGATGLEAAEAPLVEALSIESSEVRIAAARALGRVGTVGAVAPLREAASRSGEGAMRRAVRQAVAEIQSRLEGAAPGQLSLAAGESGQLSLAEADAAGRLSVADGEAKAAPSAERTRELE